MFLWLPSNYESIASRRWCCWWHRLKCCPNRLKWKLSTWKKYLLYLCELEFVFCNVQCNVEVVGGCNFSSNVLNAPQGCAGGFLSLLNTLATSSSPMWCIQDLLEETILWEMQYLTSFWTNASLICKIYSLNTLATSFYFSAFWMPKYQNTSLVGFRFIFNNIILPL